MKLRYILACLFVACTMRALADEQFNNQYILDFYESVGLDEYSDLAAKNAAKAFGDEFKYQYETRFSLELPKSYQEFAEACYLENLSWSRYKFIISKHYLDTFTKEEVDVIFNIYRTGKFDIQIASGIVSHSKIEVLLELAKNHIEEVKSECFYLSKQNVRKFHIERAN